METKIYNKGFGDMRKQYLILCLGIGIQAFSSSGAKAYFMGGGPVPLLPQTYQVNPASKMTPWVKKAMNEAFSWAGSMFQKNHARSCNNRATCLALDLKTLDAFIASRPTHPARTMFQSIYNVIRRDSQQQKFVTQWVIFQNLSPKRQEEYRSGIRITPIQSQIVRAPSGKITPALFNPDDVLTDLLEKIDHSHKNCEKYVTCLSTDLQIIKGLRNRLGPSDPSRKSLDNLSVTIKARANQEIFDTHFYLKLYDPFGADWNNTLKKHKAKKTTAYGYKEWRQIDQHSRAVSWRTPRITNGQPLKQQQPPQPRGAAQKRAPQKGWSENIGALRRWW